MLPQVLDEPDDVSVSELQPTVSGRAGAIPQPREIGGMGAEANVRMLKAKLQVLSVLSVRRFGRKCESHLSARCWRKS